MKNTVLKGALVAGASLLLLTLLAGMALAGSNENVRVALDLDPADGNQSLMIKSGVEDVIVVEVYGAVTDVKSFTITLGFDPEKLSFVPESSSVESGFQVMPPALMEAGVAGAVGLLFAGSQSGDPLLLAKMAFTPLAGFNEGFVSVKSAEFKDASDATDTPAQNTQVLITGVAVESESWGKVKAQFVQ
ncbi:MAG: hypothetical protein KAR36_05910 [Candidatus Latescibacteria bacterium]|nr:hypothetical protein [Candidatus Latescibacterota bacterium]